MPRKRPDLRKSRHNPNTPDIPGPPTHKYTLPGQHSFVKPLASHPNPTPPPVSLDCRGKIGQTVYQLTYPLTPYTGLPPIKLLQRRRHVMPYDPRTHLQLLNRSRFAAAVRAWHQLTAPEKELYNSVGACKDPRIEGLNVFLRKFIAEHDLSQFQLEAELRAAQPLLPFSGPGP